MACSFTSLNFVSIECISSRERAGSCFNSLEESEMNYVNEIKVPLRERGERNEECVD